MASFNQSQHQPGCEQKPKAAMTTLSSTTAHSDDDYIPNEQAHIATRLLKGLISESDQKSTTVLAALRLGFPWEEAAKYLTDDLLNDSNVFVSTSSGSVPELNKDISQGTPHRPTLFQPSFSTPVPQLYSDNHSPWLPNRFDRRFWVDAHASQIGRAYSSQNGGYIISVADMNGRFGNLPFSSAITANHYPDNIQRRQRENLRQPIWSILPLHDIMSNEEPFTAMYNDILSKTHAVTSADFICGDHVYIGALHDQAIYEAAPELSRALAGFVRGVKPQEPTVTITIRLLCGSIGHCGNGCSRQRLRITKRFRARTGLQQISSS